MRNYTYTYYDKNATIRRGYIHAYTLDDAKRLLAQQDFTLIKVEDYDAAKKIEKEEKLKKETPLSRFLDSIKFHKKLQYDEFIIFMKQFTVLIRSGVGIMQALEIISGQLKDKVFKKTLLNVSNSIYTGSSMYNAFKKENIFPKLFINLLHAGEISGDLPKILTDLSNYYERERELKKRAMASLTYPVVVLVVALGGMIFMVNYIFPSFIGIYKNFKMELPLPTKILLFVVDMAKNPAIMSISFIVIIIALLFFKAYISTPVGRYSLDKFILNIPIIGNITKKITLARFARTLGTVYDDGLSLHHSLEAATETVENTYYKKEFENIIARIEDEGILFSTAISEKYFLFPRIFTNLTSAGEESGDLGEMLKKISLYFEEEIFYIFDNLLSLLEPIIVITLGSMVLFIMLSLFLPLYSIINQF